MIFREYIVHCNVTGHPVYENWESIDRDDFNHFRICDYQVTTSTQAPASLAPPPTTPSTSILRDPLPEFKKGSWHDATLFPILKDEKQWDIYQHTTKAHAESHNLSEVFDDTYVPITPIDILLFKLKQEFMYSVAERTLLTDYGKTCICSHEADHDAQKIYAEVFDYMQQLSSLPPASQELCDKLPDRSKALILGSVKKSESESRKAKVHDQVNNHDGDVFMDTSTQLDKDAGYADDDNPDDIALTRDDIPQDGETTMTTDCTKFKNLGQPIDLYYRNQYKYTIATPHDCLTHYCERSFDSHSHDTSEYQDLLDPGGMGSGTDQSMDNGDEDSRAYDDDDSNDEYGKPIPPKPYWQDWGSGDWYDPPLNYHDQQRKYEQVLREYNEKLEKWNEASSLSSFG
jgi:hypothetical protein